MPSFEHTKLIERIAALDSPPDDEDEFAAWLKASGQLRLLRDNAEERELIVYASGPHTLVHAVVVSEERLTPLDQEDLLRWSGNPYHGRAGYVVSGDDVSIVQDDDDWRTDTLTGSKRLVFVRDSPGFGDGGGADCEILQEYAHVTDIHWRDEQRAYCSFDENGDIQHVVSVTVGGLRRGLYLASFKREQLEQYLAASKSVLVRMFEFWLVVPDKFEKWSDDPETVIRESEELLFRQKIDSSAAYVRGVQVIRPSRPRSELLHEIAYGPSDSGYVDLVALDFRHGRIATISTDPSAVTNYFEADSSSLPFETSPVFFRPDVLLKYKSDRDKYRVNEEHRMIDCRGGWSLRYDTNDAGQVHAYIVDLRALPYREQQYWQSFNEEPKSGISERALVHDFKGEWATFANPLGDLLTVVRRWSRSSVSWWKLRDATLLERVNTPRTSSRDEWADAFGDLASLVVEGFETSAIRAELDATGAPYETGGSLALLGRLLTAIGAMSAGDRLDGLQAVQEIRSKAASHARGRRAAQLSSDALKQHGTYAAHFESVCSTVTHELKMIEAAFA